MHSIDQFHRHTKFYLKKMRKNEGYIGGHFLAGSDPEYEQKIQFAVKLGYTEEQLQAALLKIGPQHTQNDLLAELIKQGSLSKAESEYEATTGILMCECVRGWVNICVRVCV